MDDAILDYVLMGDTNWLEANRITTRNITLNFTYPNRAQCNNTKILHNTQNKSCNPTFRQREGRATPN